MPRAEGKYVVMAGPEYETEAVAGEETLARARARRAARRSLYRDEQAGGSGGGAQGAPDELEALAGTRGTRGSRLAAMRGISLADVESRSTAILASLRAASVGLRGLKFSPLPGAELEGRLVSSQVDETGAPNEMYTRSDAQERVLVGFESAPRVVHLATHGFFLKADEELRARLKKAERSMDVVAPPPGALLRAGLAFAGVNTNAPFLGEIDTRNDGVLTALEVLSLNLTGTRLAVLSACETGLGEVHEGEGIYGLRRSFQQAGVEQVVASLWEVSDAGTQRLMAEMYSRLAEGLGPREALRDAQRELMEDPRWGYPYVWAAFTIVGR